jgi:hypothetical protein
VKEPDLVKTFLGMLGAVVALFGWRAVLSPDIPMTWKGGNRAPMSMPSRTAMAVAFTSWSLILTGFHPLVWATFFAASVAFGLGQSSRDRAAHDAVHGNTTSGMRLQHTFTSGVASCALDGLVFGAGGTGVCICQGPAPSAGHRGAALPAGDDNRISCCCNNWRILSVRETP